MSLSKELVASLQPDAVDEDTKKFNQILLRRTQQGPQWYEVGAAKFREMARKGETSLPKPMHVEHARQIGIPSREEGREIPCRLIMPQTDVPILGVFMHVHGGGWCLSAEDMQDKMLETLANVTGAIMLSVGYRLAPEHPFPAGPDDCLDVATYLIGNAEAKFSASLLFIGGESAGAYLSAVTAFALQKTKPDFELKGLILNYGIFDLSLSGSVRSKISSEFPILNYKHATEFLKAILPGKSVEERQHPLISPFYADLGSMKLPPAIFVCGTDDILMEDSILLATRWQIAGGEAVLKVCPGASHGFMLFPPDQYPMAGKTLGEIGNFIKAKGNQVKV